MYSKNTAIHRWLVLIPHRDSLTPIHELQRRLWQSGVTGGRLLPPLVYVDTVDKPIRSEQCKILAQELRQRSQERKEDGYIDGMSLGLYNLPGSITVLGLALSLHKPSLTLQDEPDVLIAKPEQASEPFLVIALEASEGVLELARKLYQETGPFRFRQGAVANLAFSLHENGNSSISCRWELGKPYWMAHHG
jgi:hypothetical protein